MRWFRVDVTCPDEDGVASIVQKFGNHGLGALLRIWAHVAHQGHVPGRGVDRHGRPFDLKNVATRVGESPAYIRRLLNSAAQVGHIDAKLWSTKQVIHLPWLARSARAYHAKKAATERVGTFRDRVLHRVSIRCGGRCVHCASVDQLELERIVPKENGGTNRESNLQISCVPCARKRRAARQNTQGKQNVTQNVNDRTLTSCDIPEQKPQNANAARNAEPIRSDLLRTGDLLSTVRTPLESRGAAPIPPKPKPATKTPPRHDGRIGACEPGKYSHLMNRGQRHVG
jgi:hypothetical protein